MLDRHHGFDERGGVRPHGLQPLGLVTYHRVDGYLDNVAYHCFHVVVADHTVTVVLRVLVVAKVVGASVRGDPYGWSDLKTGILELLLVNVSGHIEPFDLWVVVIVLHNLG